MGVLVTFWPYQSVRFNNSGNLTYGRIREIRAKSAVVEEVEPSAGAWKGNGNLHELSFSRMNPTELVSAKDLPAINPVESFSSKVEAIKADFLRSVTTLQPNETLTVHPQNSDNITVLSDDPRLSIMQPTAAMLNKINSRLMPKGGIPYEAEEVTHLPIVIVDNMVGRTLSKWDLDSLKRMSQLIIGQPFKFDHDETGAKSIWARIYDSTMIVSDSAPNSFLDRVGNGKINKKVLAEEKLVQVVAFAAVPSDSEVLEKFQRGLLSEVSVGCHCFTDIICPHHNVSFYDQSCNHAVPYSKQMSAMYSQYDLNFADYSIWSGLYDVAELSVVTVPRFPGAGAIK